MSPPVVATVAWLALAVVIGLGAVLVVLIRRLDVLSRAHTDRKWEIAALRAELAALRRDRDAPDRSSIPGPAGGDEDAARDGRSWRSGPTAWRRGRGRPPVRPPRRRRPG